MFDVKYIKKEDELSHFGIKGQKKGTRRFQYANKTYTPEGNKRYRPNKGQRDESDRLTNLAVGGSIAALAVAGIKAAANATKPVVTGTTTLAEISAAVTELGQIACSAITSVPVPVAAIAFPLTAALGAATVANIITSSEEFDDSWYK